jgi:hypothetical protein
MKLKVYVDYYGCQNGKNLKYIADGLYKDMLCNDVSKGYTLYHGKYYTFTLNLISRCKESRTAGNLPNYNKVSHDEFFRGLNIIEEIYEDTPTNLVSSL